jgi:mannose-6-phosphate isomerase-like protein (cupin superfamily)
LIIRRLRELKEIVAIDDTRLHEMLNPLHDDGELLLGYSLAHAVVKPHCESLPHRLKTSSEVYYILRGRGVMHIDDESAEVKADDVIYVPPGSRQYISNTGTTGLAFLCIVNPSWRGEDEELA